MNIDQAIHVCNGITDLWESKRHTDVTFLVQDAHITAHRIILASQSEYFDRLLFGEMREACEDEILLSDIENVEAFQLLMQYAYSGCVDIQNGDIQVLMNIGGTSRPREPGFHPVGGDRGEASPPPQTFKLPPLRF